MNKLLTRFLTIFTAALSLANAGVLRAESLDVNEAKNAATSFLLSGNSNGMAKAKLRSGQYLTLAADNQNGYYIFNRQDGGIVIVADDDALGRTVLGYTTEGAYEPENLPLGLQDWFSQITVLMDAVHAGKIDRSESLSTQQGTIVVDALIKTKWNQSAPFNNLCPVVDGERCVTGCVATAMAQVLNYWRWPEHGYGSVEYTSYKIKQNLSLDLSKSYYDWDNMLDEYTYAWNDQKEWALDCSDRQAEAVATLMRDCGYSVEMSYGSDGSGGTVSANVLMKHFNYSPLAEMIYREEFSSEEWHQILRNELDNKRPILYGGDSKQGGHEFILDGYDTNDFFHVNWGWGGALDGWFTITDMGGFNKYQTAVIGIEPITKVDPNYKEKDFSYTLSDGVLTINGAGTMPEEYEIELAPWRDQCLDIKKIIIGEGILSIASRFGSGFDPEKRKSIVFRNLEEVVLPEGLLIINDNFLESAPIEHINLPSTLQRIDYSFNKCRELRSLHLPKSLKKIQCYELSNLEKITIDAANPYLSVKDNIVMNKEETKIMMVASNQKRITIFENVTEIVPYAIEQNQAVVIVAQPITAPTLSDWGFFLSNQSGILYVKAGAKGYDEWLSFFPEDWVIRTYTDENQIPSIEYNWTLKDGLLTISGVGDMPYNNSDRPYDKYRSEITKIKLEEGVMNLGWAAFWNFQNTKEIELPSTIQSVEYRSFGNSGITKIVCLAKTAPQIWSQFADMQTKGVLQVLEGCDYSSWLAALPRGWTIEYIKHPLIGKIDELKDYLLEIKTEGVNTKELDANKDGKLSVSDITEMARQLSE